jgi:hypothetical protein
MTGTAQYGAQQELYALTGTAVGSVTTYLALCTADPSSAVTVAEISEVTTAGYARAEVVWNTPTAAYPSVITNSNLIVWGPMSANMALAAQWVAMVTSASGTSGQLLYTWTLDDPQQVYATQEIAIAAGELSISQS